MVRKFKFWQIYNLGKTNLPTITWISQASRIRGWNQDSRYVDHIFINIPLYVGFFLSMSPSLSPISFSLSLYPSISIYVDHIFIFINIPLYTFFSLHFSLFLSLSLSSISLSFSLSLSFLSLPTFFSLSFYLFLSLFLSLYMFLSLSLSLFLSLSTFLSLYFSLSLNSVL